MDADLCVCVSVRLGACVSQGCGICVFGESIRGVNISVCNAYMCACMNLCECVSVCACVFV